MYAKLRQERRKGASCRVRSSQRHCRGLDSLCDRSPGSLRSPGAIDSAATAAEQLLNLSTCKCAVHPGAFQFSWHGPSWPCVSWRLAHARTTITEGRMPSRRMGGTPMPRQRCRTVTPRASHGHVFCLGLHDTSQSKQKYARLVQGWLANVPRLVPYGRVRPDPLRILPSMLPIRPDGRVPWFRWDKSSNSTCVLPGSSSNCWGLLNTPSQLPLT